MSSTESRPFDFHIAKGEVNGFTGLLGSGRSESVRAIFGADRVTGGKVKINGKDVHIASPHDAMKQGKVAILVGGTGNPYFTTDTGSSLRGIEIEADVMLKGTRVDGVYTADPEKDPTAVKFQEITFDEIYNRNLKVMDLTATTMCKENDLPIYVFNMDIPGNLKKAMSGEPIGTLVHK